MPDWSELLTEINQGNNPHDAIRRKYLKKLHECTGRNVILYYSGWHQKGHFSAGGVRFDINDSDKNGFMTAIHKLDRKKGLDLVLHTPGGDTAATESIVDYLLEMFPDIRAIIPQIAMSAGTMIALACHEIVMGKQSSLGPIDPQFNGIPAHGIIEEFTEAQREVSENPRHAILWQQIIQKYNPTLIGECKKAIAWSNLITKEWLLKGMFASEPNRDELANKVVEEFGDHSLTLSHSRHISIRKARELGLKIVELELDPNLQDAVLSVHHACIHSLASTNAYKIIENHDGHAVISCLGSQFSVATK